MKNFKLILVTILFCFSNISFAQAPEKVWDKSFGGNLHDYARSVIQTSDGGCLLGGWSESTISGEKSEFSRGYYDYWVVKVDVSGNKTWDKTFGGTGDDRCYSVAQTSDGGYFLGGYSASTISGDKSENSRGGYDYWIVKIDANGNKIWDKTFGGSGSDYCNSIIQTSDGGCLIGGWSESNISGEKSEDSRGNLDYWIVKVDVNGNITWDKTYGGSEYEECSSVFQTTDGGYIIGGWSHSDISGDKTEVNRGEAEEQPEWWDEHFYGPWESNKGSDYWIVKIDAIGNKIWDKTFGGNKNDVCFDIIQTADGGYLIGGSSESNISGEKSEIRGSSDYWIVKTDAYGNKSWDKVFGGTGPDDCTSVKQTTDGGYILGGHSASNISGEKSENSFGSYDLWIVKIETNGNKTWDKTFGGNDTENPCRGMAIQTTDGGYLVGGYSYSNISGEKSENSHGENDYWIVKMEADMLPPIAVCQNATLQLDASGQAILTPSNVDNGSSGNNITISVSPNSFNCNNIGNNIVILTVTDDIGNIATCEATVTVADNIAPQVLTQNITVQLDESGNANIAPDDVDAGSSDACGIASITVSPDIFTCANIGNNVVTLTATDVNGHSSSATATVTVENDAPVIATLTGPEHPTQLGSAISLNISFYDLNATNVNVQWDDGTEDSFGSSNGAAIAEHIYLTPGVYSVIVSVTDICGLTDVTELNYVVIYDSNEGFVTGGGWIDSPEGAYKPDLSLTGKANFGFVAKYKKGSSTPDGNTEFQFKAGNLNFNSSDYEYLVIIVAGAKAIFKGSGTINGSGNYGFMLGAIDADLTPSAEKDKFRIKIWEIDGDIVYDNNIDGEDNADPATTISGGSITIHSSNEKSATLEAVTEYSDLKVYPNPFSEKLRFEFASPENTHARIDLYDATGRFVKNIFKGSVEARIYYNSYFEPVSEVSGLYFYRMTLGETVYNGKVIYKK